ncbi:MAG: TonB-dependent receptor [Gemmatimonadales bacterium]
MLFVLALMAFAIPAAAQTGSITGKVTSGGKAVSGVTVQAVSGLRTVAAAQSDENGDYRLTNLQPGSYAVTARLIGYTKARNDNVSVGSGATATSNITIASAPTQLNEIVTTASKQPEKVIDAPATVTVITAAQVQERAAVNIADHVVAIPGVDVARGGIARSNIVARGFNNIFSGALLTLTDNRFAFVPSLRVNIPYLSPTTNEDIDRIEVVLGPAAALYGPNTASGVMAVTTKSPFTSQGTTLTVDGGNQNLVRGSFRTAWAPTPKFGFKATYDVFHAKEWDYCGGGASFTDMSSPCYKVNDTVGERKVRNNDVDRQGGEIRADFRPTPASEIIANYGRSMAGNAVEPTGLGPAQVKDWVYQTYQLRGRFKQLFGQVFLNTSDAGKTFLLTSVKPTTSCPDTADRACIIDRSSQLAAQVQDGFQLGARQHFLVGYDYIHTMPKTEGTINGRHEDNDDITENGAYIHSVTDFTDQFQLTAAARVDKHSRLESAVFSPRVALVFKPVENQNFRLTYNRAFSTPSTNNLFLDLIAQSNAPLFNVRAFGVPNEGLHFKRDCAAGLGGLCMQAFAPFGGTGTFSAANPYQTSFTAAKAGVIASLTASFQAAGLPAPNAQAQATAVANFLGSLQPTAGQVGTTLVVPGTGTVKPSQLLDVNRLKPEIHNTYEAGYKGIIANRLQISLDAWKENRKNFVGPLTLETPLVFMKRDTLNAYLTAQLTGFFQAAGLPAAQAGGQAALIAAGLSCSLPGNDRTACTGAGSAIPVGVVTFDNSLIGTDAIVTYRNFGSLDLWGSDFGAEYLLDGGFSLAGTYSYVNKNLFSKSDVGGISDISLNAPANKHSLTAKYRNETTGWSGEVRERHVDGFKAVGFFSGSIQPYTLVDAGISYRPSNLNGVLLSVNGTNLANKVHQEFAQGGLIGRLIITRLQVTF